MDSNDMYGGRITSEEKSTISMYVGIGVAVILIAVAVYFFFHFVHHPVATGDPRHEVPLIGDQVADKLRHEDLTAPAADKPGQLEQPANVSANADPSQNGPVMGPESPQSADRPPECRQTPNPFPAC